MKIKNNPQQPNPPSAVQRAQRLSQNGTPDEQAQGKVHGMSVTSLPKDYRRTDEEIRSDVREQLVRRVETSVERIDVTVDNGEVTLAGDVSGEDLRAVAEQVASSVLGASKVKNNLAVPGSES
ncbi:MAG: BON domain-containing protein [Bdellovibrionota bacterium]